MSQIGLDMASIDANAKPDTLAARAAGVRFVYIRRSHCYFDAAHKAFHLAHDHTYERDSAAWRSVGVVVGAYLFPSFKLGAPTVKEQVANFLAAGGDVLVGRDLPVALDVEFPGKGIADTGRSQAEVFVLVLEFVRELRKHFTAVAIYTSHVQWHDTNGLGGPDSPELDGVILWQKTPYRLQSRQPLDTVPPKDPHTFFLVTDPHSYWQIPRPWSNQGWWIQQYQGDCLGFAGFDKTVDVNRFCVTSSTSTNSKNIEWIQKRLRVPQTRMWDTLTGDAVKLFQSSRGFVADGVVGVATFSALVW